MNNLKHFTYSISNPDETDLVVISVTDSRTGFTVRTALPNSGKQTASIMAFAGARFSRSDLGALQLFQEIKQAGSNANEKLANIFKNYGHASVADMAQLFGYIENVPDVYSTIFYGDSSVGGGQQRSTRYQDFRNSQPVDLKSLGVASRKAVYSDIASDFENLQKDALSKYTKWADRLPEIYTHVYQLDKENKREMAALTARVFDTARYFLPSGVCNKTSFAYITSAREWARLVSNFKASDDTNLVYLGEQIEALFAPDPEYAAEIGYVAEAPDLIRYTSSDETTGENLKELRQYLETSSDIQSIFDTKTLEFKPLSTMLIDPSVTAGTKVMVQNILTLYPALDIRKLIDWLQNLDEDQKVAISRLVFSNFTHHKQMGSQFKVNTHSFVLTCSNSEMRDLNRHRAWGRFVPILSTQNYSSLLEGGYTLPLYLTDNLALVDVRDEFEADLVDYYRKLEVFIAKIKKETWFPQHLLVQLLPFGHVFTMFFHASPKEISYLTQLRVRPGGHINYRMLAHQMAELAANSEPFLAGLDLGDGKKPNPSSREEFIDRS
jgi:thymidylate synthase ThyX